MILRRPGRSSQPPRLRAVVSSTPVFESKSAAVSIC
jgi:hypothetical protein